MIICSLLSSLLTVINQFQKEGRWEHEHCEFCRRGRVEEENFEGERKMEEGTMYS